MTTSSTRKVTSTNFGNQRLLGEACVLNDTLYRIGMRWKMQVLYSVSRGHVSFGALKRELPSVSDHVLGRRLRELVEESLLEKSERGERRWAYAVTPRGRELLEIMQRICDWEIAAAPRARAQSPTTRPPVRPTENTLYSARLSATSVLPFRGTSSDGPSKRPKPGVGEKMHMASTSKPK